MSTKPRNPRYFPLMKVRGARRRQVALYSRMAGSFDVFKYALAEAAEAFRTFAASFPASLPASSPITKETRG